MTPPRPCRLTFWLTALIFGHFFPTLIALGGGDPRIAFPTYPFHLLLRPFDLLRPSTSRACIGAVAALGKGLERLPGIRYFSGSLLLHGLKPAAAPADPF